jgi:hypothetical protein
MFMKASKMIKLLEELVRRNGDLPLEVVDDIDCTFDVGSVSLGKCGACDVIQIIVG